MLDSLLFECFILLLKVALDANEILVELVLGQKIASDSLVEGLDLFLLVRDLIRETVVNLVDLLELQLQEGMLIDV